MQNGGAENAGSNPDFDPSKELVVNHLENNREITTKTGVIRSLKAYYKDNIQASKYPISQILIPKLLHS